MVNRVDPEREAALREVEWRNQIEQTETLKRIEELLIGFAQTQERIARTLSILVGSAQHGRSR